MKKKISTIIGTRPEIIKMYPIINELDKNFDNQLIWSGQHYDFSMVKNIFLDVNLRKPDHFINIKDKSSTFFEIQKKIFKILKKNNSKAIIYHGDTFTTLASALVSRFLFPKILNIHVEGGYRSFDTSQTEEQVRFITDHISKINFIQRPQDKKNLNNENHSKETHIVGNSIKDSVDIIKKSPLFKTNYLKKYNLKKNDYIYCTIHRSENVDNPQRLKKIIKIIRELSIEKKIIIPIHPRTKNKLKVLNFKNYKNIIFTKPLKYSESIFLLSKCFFSFSDSGGIQEEAIILRKRCLIPSDKTPHNYYIHKKANYLVNLNSKNYLNKIQSFLKLHNEKSKIKKFYHPRNIGKKIVKLINRKI